jgi:hypothetical protein
MIILS